MTYSKRYSFRGRTALVTGAASGIGRALAVALARRGAHLALVDRNEEGLKQTRQLARTAGDVGITTYVVDLTDAHAVAGLPRDVLASHPGVDILINNAGVALGGTFEQVSERDFQWLFEINFWGVVRMTRVFLPFLRASDDAVLANISSIFGVIAPPGQTAYAASKFAVRGFTMSLRNELKDTTVFVTAVHPGGIATSIAENAREPEGVSDEERVRRRTLWKKMLKMSPDDAAAVILDGIERRKARILVGRDAWVAALAERVSPTSYGKLLRMLAPK